MKPKHHPFLRRWVDRFSAETAGAAVARGLVYLAIALCAASVHRYFLGAL